MELDQLIKQLSDQTREVFESAVALAANRGHFDVDVMHWLLALLNSEKPTLLEPLGSLDTAKLQTTLEQWMESRQTGCEGYPRIHQDLIRLLFDSWMTASTEFHALQVSPGHMLLVMLEGQAIRSRMQRLYPDWSKISSDRLREAISPNDEPAQASSDPSTQGKALARFTQNLTAQAREGKIDQVVGRNDEIRQMIDVLTRRRQNNPILTGEAGVGKTAVVEGLAVQIVKGEVPESLKNIELYNLDLGLLQAGASVKGEFENRLKNLIKDVQSSPTPIILFIDEAHTLIGSGQAPGQGDAANLLKPALARGELRTIAATTWSEYKQFIENDAALTRRFQVIKVEEPDEEKAVMMLGSLVDSLQKHHQVRILHEAVVSAVSLSKKYITGRQLPDKCVSVLDTACARVNLSLQAKPAEMERLQQELEQTCQQTKRLSQEIGQGFGGADALIGLKEKAEKLQQALSEEQIRWEKAQVLLRHISEIRTELDGEGLSQADRDTSLAELQRLRNSLKQIHDGFPLVYECVDANVVADVISDWTGIPVRQMHRDDLERALALHDNLSKRVLGQPNAISAVSQALKNAQAKLNDPNRPLAVLMLVGPSGVGKTETALALAEQLYGGEQQLTTLNMSEFKESHKVSLLMGSPPGYVGYGKGGQLTEAVRRKPYSVILLDELEKAHPEVHDVFYQVFDKGILRDSEGRNVDFKQTVVIMTCNTASEQIEALCADPETAPEPAALLEAIQPALRKDFKPAFLGRVTVVPYYPLDNTTLADIAHQQLDTLAQRIEQQYRVPLHYQPEVIENIVEQCQQSDTGARLVATRLNQRLVPHLSEALLSALAHATEFNQITVSLTGDGQWEVELDEVKPKK